LGPDEFTQVLNEAVRAYKTPPYEHTPLIYPPGYLWLSGDTPPSTVLSFDDVDDTIIVAPLWTRASGIEIALFPLGSGDERLQGLAVIGEIKRRDPSLRSIGTYPENTVALTSPPITEMFLANFLTLAGYPATPGNLAIADIQLAGLFKIKAWEFINSRDPRTAERFVAEHGRAPAQRVLDDLAAWNPGVIPYIQELPYRVQGVVLRKTSQSENDPFWEGLTR
jgi:hypothetical protein